MPSSVSTDSDAVVSPPLMIPATEGNKGEREPQQQLEPGASESLAGRVKSFIGQVEQRQRAATTPTAGTTVQPRGRDPKLRLAAARDAVRISLSPRSKPNNVSTATPTSSTAIRTAFGKFRRSNTTSTRALPVSQPSEAPISLETPESPAATPDETDGEQDPSSPSGANDGETGRGFVDEVRRTLDQLVVQLDGVDPKKLLAIRLGAELRGLLGKAQDEFGAYEDVFVEHAALVGISIALQNFAASLTQVFDIIARLQTAKFLLNKTFKRDVTFAFQEINAYYTSLFMELSMAVARRSGIELPLPSPVKPQPPPPAIEPEVVLPVSPPPPVLVETSTQTDFESPPGSFRDHFVDENARVR